MQKGAGISAAPFPAQAIDRQGLNLFLERVRFQGVSHVAEFSLGSARIPEILLNEKLNPACRYTAVCNDSPASASLAERLLPFGERVKSVVAPFTAPLPLDSGGHDLLLSCYVLEQLPMDQLYMAFSEARRILQPGSRWAVLARVPGKSAISRLVSGLQKARGVPMIILDHFLSPEDWEVETDERLNRITFSSRLMILRRLG